MNKQNRAEGKGVEPSSQRMRTALAVRPGQPYPATFQSSGQRSEVRGQESARSGDPESLHLLTSDF